MSIQDCDKPSLVLGGFRIWVFGRAFPDTTEWWDRDLLQVRAECQAPGSVVTVTGAILRSDEIADLLVGIKAMHTWESKSFDWTLREPNLGMSLRSSPAGHLAIEVDITPDHMTQWHKFQFCLDLTYLLEPIAQCGQMLSAFPVTVGGISIPVKISN